MKQILLFLCLMPAFTRLQAQPTREYPLNGIVTDSLGRGVAGATIRIGSFGKGSVTGADGRFHFSLPAGRYNLYASYIGFKPIVTEAVLPMRDSLRLVMRPASGMLQEVTVSTGYQELPKERATGSFVQANRQLLERSVSTDIIDRLKGVVPGLSFNSVGTRISIRGQSTLFSNAEPLIVVDGFPYNQPIENLNPNDVETVNVLRDAAAASIWGSKAGNGVIVITTKRGRFNQAPTVTLNTNITVGERPDLLGLNRMSSSDYIDIEKRLFSENYFDGTEQADGHLPLSPVVELLIAGRDGTLSAADVNARIDQLRKNDVQKDYLKYLYRPSVNQQYAHSLDGGNAVQRYFFSAGYDRNLDNLRGNGFDRVTLNGSNTWRMLNDKLELSTSLNLTQTATDRNNPGAVTWDQGNAVYPYARLLDDKGQPQAITRDLRQGYVDAAPAAGVLDWSYSPIRELQTADNKSTVTDIRLNTGLKYKLPLGFSAELRYQYDHSNNAVRNLYSQQSYFTRNLINRYTQDDGSGALSRPVPLGAIYDLTDGTSINHDGRGQLNFDRTFGSRHELNTIAGYEVQTLNVRSGSNRLFGYDPDHATSMAIDGAGNYTLYDNPFLSRVIPQNREQLDATDHYRSYYANAAYTYDGRLTLSGSARLDQSNLFGVNSNQKGVPLWSAGAAWNLSRESFYHLSWLPQFKLRATIGYNGNINKNLSAYTTAGYFDGSDSQTALPYAQILNPPNPDLRWERIRNINLGLDFGLPGNRVTGSLEYYSKKGVDLIGQTALAPSTGQTIFTGNNAATSGHGLDFSIDTRNLTGPFNWTTNFFLSHVTDKVTQYTSESPAGFYLSFGQLGAFAQQDRPLFAVYSYRSAGLDPATGDPQGYLDGLVSKDYNAILKAATPANLVYNGPSRPTVFGALRNTFTYSSWSLSANITYKLGYYFRRNSIRYGNQYGLSTQNGDYGRRWQQPGDEQHTHVPSIPAVTDSQRDDFYTYSSALVEKGDHVRLQDLRLAWTMDKGLLPFAPGARLQVYVYGANLGILWRANKYHLDPDVPNSYPQPRTIAGGLRLTY
ncbi:SusC/RagA family TonB-linked outer membrane protein [Mucilaginibacter phyllosphaerae]